MRSAAHATASGQNTTTSEPACSLLSSRAGITPPASPDPTPTLLFVILHRVRDAFYVAHEVGPQAVLAEDVQDLQQLFAV